MRTLPHHCMLTLVHTPIKHKHGGGGEGGREGGREGGKKEGSKGKSLGHRNTCSDGAHEHT